MSVQALQFPDPWHILMDTAEFIRERMISDLVASERLLKEAALQVVRDFRSVLFSTAQRLDSQRVQDLLRVDPSTFQSWSPVQWQAFFNSLLDDGRSWSSQEGCMQEALGLKAENRRLRKDAETARRQSETLRTQVENLQRRLDEAEARLRTLQAVRIAPQPAPLLEAAENTAYGPLLKAMREWAAPDPPARFKAMVSDDPLRWRRQSISLSIMAASGISTRVELDYLVGALEDIKSRSSSLRTTLDVLADRGLVIASTFNITYGAFQSALSVMRLSETGKELCRILGWEPVEADWERINRLGAGERQRDRTFGLLAFTMHARLRGWQVQVLPEVQGDFQPDLRIQRPDASLYVEVAMNEEDNPDIWRQQAALQGQVALCAATRAQQDALAESCRRLSLPGQAASLEDLAARRIPDIRPETPLWEATWQAG